MSAITASCCGKKKGDSTSDSRPAVTADTTKQKPATPGLIAATVKDNSGLDGCTFLLVLYNGKKIEPLNLPAEYKKDGMKVRVKYHQRKDAMSVCMSGEIVMLDIIEKAE